MADLIDRQSAIREIARWIGYIDEDMITRIQIGLKKLPSVQSEQTPTKLRFTGGETKDGRLEVKCSACGFSHYTFDPDWERYCYYCGRRFEKADAERRE